MRSTKRTPSPRHGLLAALCAGLLLLAFAPQPVRAQGGSSSGPSQQQKAMHYSLYYENFKNDNFQSALKDLRWILANAPGFPKGDDRNFERAVEVYANLAEQADSEDKRMAYLDTAATYLNTAEDRLKEKGLTYNAYEWELEKGRFIQQYGSALPDGVQNLENAAAHYERAFDLAPEKINPYYINQVLSTYMENNQQNKALAFIDKVESQRGDDEEVQKILAEKRTSIFGKNPQARIDFLQSKLEENPDDAAVMADLFGALVDQGNIEAAAQLADRLMATNPSAEVVRDVAKMRLEDGRPEEAFQTYKKAEEQGAELNEQDYYNMGLALQRSGQLAQARAHFRKAIDQKSDFGQAYIAIGDVYAKAVSDCGGSKMGRGDKAVYWLAVDMYRRAKQVDSSVASTADSKINTYRQYFPNQEDIFYRSDWTEGESFRIDYGCYSWINESTTVRQAS